jgi:NAD(P)-dependent dehydrogenase (short-subunit alcohol dehydrogenase family)
MRTSPEAWKRTLEVNLAGAFNTVRAALPSVVERRGYVAVTASVASFAAAPAMSAYAASKAGVEAMFNALRLEVAHLGVDVGTIHPTWIATAMVEEGDSQIDAFARLRSTLSFPLNKTYPVERAARDIARGFERRSRRVGVPGWVRGLHALRSATTTRVFERDLRKAAPDIDRLFAEQASKEGVEGASVSERVKEQVPAD